MSNKIIEPVIKNPKIEIDNALLEEIKHQTEKQVIVHCYFYPQSFFSRYRVSKNTYLKSGSYISQLVECYNISYSPTWTPVIGTGKKIFFTLIFQGLPKDCKSFNLIEDISVGNGFYGSFNRCDSDVYTLEVGI